VTRNEQGSGTIRTVRDRSSGEVLGYQALLPREFSKPPPGCKNPETYQQPVGPRLDLREEARRLLDAAIGERLSAGSLALGLPLSSYLASEIKSRLSDARREYRNDARANKNVSTWNSINRVWLSKSPFYQYPPSAIDATELQSWFDWLRDSAEKANGDPLSGNFIRNIAQFLRATFDRARIKPNPVDTLTLPDKNHARFVHLEIAAQREFFDSQVDLEDRTMAGCGMGGGLRVGELLSLERTDVFLDVPDPHLIVRYGGDHRAPPKGRRVRRVELIEPGLGFFALWLERFYKGGVRLFEGPQGGYLKAWPELFPAWSDIVGKQITSHVMRHSYAVAMLSGTWGYDPQSLEFIQHQLGHADRSTTERFYGAYESGTWQRHARHLAGREARPAARRPLMARELLGLDVSNDVPGGFFLDKMKHSVRSPSLTQISKKSDRLPQTDAHTHQSLREQAVGLLQAIETDDPQVHAKAISLARSVLLEDARGTATVSVAVMGSAS